MKNKKKQLRKEADNLWKIAIIQHYGDRCLACGKPSGPPHHFIKKSRSNYLRFNISNGVPLCCGCHMKLHQGEPEINQSIIAKRGKLWYNKIIRMKNTPVKVNLGWYQEQIDDLNKAIKGNREMVG